MIVASGGSAAIAGLDVRTHRLEASKRLGYLPENGPLYQNMTPLELLAFFSEARSIDADTFQKQIKKVIKHGW